jgi:hypothetical protein
VNLGAPKRTRGDRKRPRVLTSDRRTCYPNLSRQRLWKAETVRWKQFFTCFLILPDEFIDNQIDNLAIPKNCRKGPRAAWDPLHPWSGAIQFCVNVLKHLLGVAQPGLETYHWIKLRSEDPKRWTKSAEAEGTQQCKTKLFWVLREIPSALWIQAVDRRLLTTYFWFCGDNGNGSPNQEPSFVMPQKHVNRYSERSKPINFCSWPPLWPLVLVLVMCT